VTVKSGLEITQGHWNWCYPRAWFYHHIEVRLLFGNISNMK